MYIKLPFLRLEDVYCGNIFTDYMAAVAKLTVHRMSSDAWKYNPRVCHERKKNTTGFHLFVWRLLPKVNWLFVLLPGLEIL